MAPIVEVRDLVKVYAAGTAREVRAVDRISFRVDEGEVFGFLGPNGAGKTTTIRILTTLLRKGSGDAIVAGHEVDREPAAVRRLIGYTGQSVGVDPDLTARETLLLLARLYGVPAAEAPQRAAKLLRILGLEEAADRPAFTYSGGMRRRLDLAAGLVHHPRLLFLDEPTTGLDPQTRLAVWEHLRAVNREEGVTIFLTTQYMEEADRLCGRVAIIDRGRIVALDSPARLKAAIGGDVVRLTLPRTGEFDVLQRRAIALLKEAPDVKHASAFEEGVSLHVADGGKAVAGILRALDAERIPVGQVSISQPSLDEVFLQHTGRRMRAEEVKPTSRGFGLGIRRG